MSIQEICDRFVDEIQRATRDKLLDDLRISSPGVASRTVSRRESRRCEDQQTGQRSHPEGPQAPGPVSGRAQKSHGCCS